MSSTTTPPIVDALHAHFSQEQTPYKSECSCVLQWQIQLHVLQFFFSIVYLGKNLLYWFTIQSDIFLIAALIFFIIFCLLNIIKELVGIRSSPFTAIFDTPYLMINLPVRYLIPYRERRNVP